MVKYKLTFLTIKYCTKSVKDLLCRDRSRLQSPGPPVSSREVKWGLLAMCLPI